MPSLFRGSSVVVECEGCGCSVRLVRNENDGDDPVQSPCADRPSTIPPRASATLVPNMGLQERERRNIRPKESSDRYAQAARRVQDIEDRTIAVGVPVNEPVLGTVVDESDATVSFRHRNMRQYAERNAQKYPGNDPSHPLYAVYPTSNAQENVLMGIAMI